jgi:Flp pilus assembly protein TadG
MRIRGRGRRRSGAAAVEVAMIMPVFLIMILGVIEAARFGMAMQLITTATREGCRVAVRSGMLLSDVQKIVDDTLAGSGIPATFTVSQTLAYWTPSSTSNNPYITIYIDIKYDDITWLPNCAFFQGVHIKSLTTMISERP